MRENIKVRPIIFSFVKERLMAFWAELIWVGNTLYPRWFVWVVCAAIILGVATTFWMAWRGSGY